MKTFIFSKNDTLSGYTSVHNTSSLASCHTPARCRSPGPPPLPRPAAASPARRRSPGPPPLPGPLLLDLRSSKVLHVVGVHTDVGQADVANMIHVLQEQAQVGQADVANVLRVPLEQAEGAQAVVAKCAPRPPGSQTLGRLKLAMLSTSFRCKQKLGVCSLFSGCK